MNRAQAEYHARAITTARPEWPLPVVAKVMTDPERTLGFTDAQVIAAAFLAVEMAGSKTFGHALDEGLKLITAGLAGSVVLPVGAPVARLPIRRCRVHGHSLNRAGVCPGCAADALAIAPDVA